MEHLENTENAYILTHPLIQHKISRLRDENTGTNEFRKLIEEIAMLMGYEALGDLPLEDVEVKTPIETCMTPMISGKKMAVVPILRAGLGMVNGILALVPSAKVGENNYRSGSHARHRRLRLRSSGFHQAARRQTHQIHVYHRRPRRPEETP